MTVAFDTEASSFDPVKCQRLLAGLEAWNAQSSDLFDMEIKT